MPTHGGLLVERWVWSALGYGPQAARAGLGIAPGLFAVGRLRRVSFVGDVGMSWAEGGQVLRCHTSKDEHHRGMRRRCRHGDADLRQGPV